MWIEKISLKYYRNYDDVEASFSPHLNVFIGKNAQGKTNFLEAIYFLALTRSHRTRFDKDLIQFNQNELQISGLLHRLNGKMPLDIQLSNKGRITKVNHLKQAKLSDYIGTMTVVLFAPEDLQLVKGSPSLRRKFLDIDLGQMKPLYLSDLSNYNHILKQRNAYLKQVDKVDRDFLAVLDSQLIDYGSKVMDYRYKFVKELSIEANKYHQAIAGQEEELHIDYLSSVAFDTIDKCRECFCQQLQDNQKRDLFKRNTSIGPHRDDLRFFINATDASFGSQGQQRSLVLSLKLAEIELIKRITGEAPILLLDDVMSELDNYRQEKLLEVIRENVQTFITTTSIEHLHNLPDHLKLFTIENGYLANP